MSTTKELSECTKLVKARIKHIVAQNSSLHMVSAEDYDFLLNESARLLINPELDVSIISLKGKDAEYLRKIGSFEAGSTQKVSTAIRARLKKEVGMARGYVKSIENIIEFETQLEHRNHRRSLGYRVLNTFAIYGAIISMSMFAHYGLGINLALTSFESTVEVPNCKQTNVSKEQIIAVLNAIKDEDIAKYVEKQLIENCSDIK